MDVDAMLANSHTTAAGRPAHHQSTERNAAPAHASLTKQSTSSTSSRTLRSGEATAATTAATTYSSPAKKDKKHVVFQLVDTQDPRIQARLPMRVMISAHDTAESIITTVKNFYGLYEYGVSFEDKQGIGMVAAYDNFEHDMVVYVRTVALPRIAPSDHPNQRDSASPKRPTLGAPIELRHGLSPTRSGAAAAAAAARSAGARSMSPTSDAGRRSISAAPGGRAWPQRTKTKENLDGDGYSSGDNAEGSVASSRRSKAEVVNAEISIDNIVEGGRRKRAFESSELPLFVPPQVPMSTSISSVSPQRRAGPPHASPYASYPHQQTFSYQHALPSPQSHGGGASGQLHSGGGVGGNGTNGAHQHQHQHQQHQPPPPPSRQLRARSGQIFYPPRHANGGILPTPDPTVGSAISDEDVALQLMRLGDPTAFSHGRNSTSTADDAFSGKAEAASSDEEGGLEGDNDDDDEDDDDNHNHNDRASAPIPRLSQNNTGPSRKKQRLMNELPSDGTSSDEYEDRRDATFNDSNAVDTRKKPSKPSKARPSSTATNKASRPRTNSMSKPKSKPSSISTAHPTMSGAQSKGLVSPASMPAPSRKGSIASATAPLPQSANSALTFHHALGQDEEDLSSKPRCQRCRKSKKGCDRQRPCGRCRDAGIGIEGCVSEDEGNGRKGRYGRHMGVPIKRSDESLANGYSKMECDTSNEAISVGEKGFAHGHGSAYVSNGHDAHSALHHSTIAASGHTNGTYTATAGGNHGAPFLAPALPDKNKKRKR